MKQINVLFFASLRDLTSERKIELSIPDGLTIGGLKEILFRKYPQLNTMKDVLIISMNHEFAFDDIQINDQAEIALFPPVSGG